MEKFKIQKILVPVDFSELSLNALKQAIVIAKAADAKIKIIHVAQQVYFPTEEEYAMANYPINKTIQKRSHAELKKLVTKIKSLENFTVDFEIKSGNVTDAICTSAHNENIDLIVMATHGTSGVKEFFAGSNAYKVVHHSTCPVLTLQKNSSAIDFKNIILPIRLERSSRQKVDYVVELAQLFDSTIYIEGYTDEQDEEKHFKIKQYVAQVEKYIAKFNVKFKSKLIFAPHYIKQIIKQAEKNKAGLIVVMKEHDNSFDQLLKGSYSQQFVNHSPFPVLSIPVFSNPDLITYTPSLSGSAPY